MFSEPSVDHERAELTIDGDGITRTLSLAELADAESYVFTVVADFHGGSASVIGEHW